MEAANADRDALGAKLPGNVQGARVLVRLNAYDTDQRLPATLGKVAEDAGG